ncbi:MAG: hypothetical protein PHP52_02425 [Bacteroidales bacterium]|nr:hypothetical protein [Bacteroidales bacterium]MDD4216295.1 hypothetical protein [Bacteroidales bacterium]
MENLLTIKEKIKNVNYILQKIDKDGLSLIEKDIILQELRGLYTLVTDLNISVQETEKPVDKIQKIDAPTVQNQKKTIAADTTENIVEFLDSSSIEDEPKELEVVEAPVKIVDDTPAKPKLVKSEPAQQNLFGNNGQTAVVTIGEQLGQHKTSLNESFSTGANTNDISSKFGQKPISDIKAAIGIGDRFLYIRELFNGNNDEFEENIIHLNSLNSFEEANNYLKEKYNWDYSQETVSNFINVVKRKYL